MPFDERKDFGPPALANLIVRDMMGSFIDLYEAEFARLWCLDLTAHPSRNSAVNRHIFHFAANRLIVGCKFSL